MGKPDERSPFADTTNVRDRLLLRGIKPRKKWGQTFLTRPDVAERIVEAAGLAADDVVLEIGPGAGALTGLLAQRARRVVAVEFDRGLVQLLREDWAEWQKVEIVDGDILGFDLAALCAREGVPAVQLVGNLPYAITTPILEWIIAGRTHIAGAVMLVQREYAARLAAAPGTADYGSLTVFARFYLRLEPLFHVPPGSFWPRPAVDSTLVRVRFRTEAPVEVPDEARLFALVRASFGQRRKTIGNALLPLFDGDRARVERLLRSAHIAANRRGETLDLEDFARLARHEAPYLDGAGDGTADHAP